MFSAFGKRNIGNFRGSHLIGKNMYCERTAIHNSHYFVIYIWSAVISHVALYREITNMHAAARKKFEDSKFVAFMPQEKFTTNNLFKTS